MDVHSAVGIVDVIATICIDPLAAQTRCRRPRIHRNGHASAQRSLIVQKTAAINTYRAVAGQIASCRNIQRAFDGEIFCHRKFGLICYSKRNPVLNNNILAQYCVFRQGDLIVNCVAIRTKVKTRVLTLRVESIFKALFAVGICVIGIRVQICRRNLNLNRVSIVQFDISIAQFSCAICVVIVRIIHSIDFAIADSCYR